MPEFVVTFDSGRQLLVEDARFDHPDKLHAHLMTMASRGPAWVNIGDGHFFTSRVESIRHATPADTTPGLHDPRGGKL